MKFKSIIVPIGNIIEYSEDQHGRLRWEIISYRNSNWGHVSCEEIDIIAVIEGEELFPEFVKEWRL